MGIEGLILWLGLRVGGDEVIWSIGGFVGAVGIEFFLFGGRGFFFRFLFVRGDFVFVRFC